MHYLHLKIILELIFAQKFDLKFDTIIAGNDVEKGNHIRGIKKIMKKLNFKNNSIFYIGDTIYDYKCSQKVEIKYIHVNWGFEKILKKKMLFLLIILKN